MGRKPLSKKKRFEILKRDHFTCKYCGRKSPDVQLEVDHIIPVAKGGTNDNYNLITSCRDCNRGKGTIEVSEQIFDDEEIDEETQLECSLDYFEAYIKFKTEFSISEEQRRILKIKYLEYGYGELSNAIDISISRYFDGSFPSFTNMITKIGGILYNRRQQGYGNL